MRIFVSYSLRCGCVTQKHLDNLRHIQRQLSNISMYIDIFDNPQGYNGGKKSLRCPAHRYVLSEIRKSDVFLLLSDPSVSPWVYSELNLARKLDIPIRKVTEDDLSILLDNCNEKRLTVISNLLIDSSLVA